MTIATGKLTDSGVSRLTDKLAKMNKRAVRMSLDELVLTVVKREAITTKSPSGLDYTVYVNHVEVAGELPCIDGWRVAGRVEYTEHGNLVHCAPWVDNLDSRYRTIGNVCEHCNTNRRRNDVIVLRNDAGRELCVGRNCVADFIRSGDAEALIWYAGLIGSDLCSECDEDWDMRGGRVPAGATPMTVVSAASICIRKLGWVSGKTAYDYDKGSTKNDVIDLLFPPYGSEGRRAWEHWIKRNDLTVTDHDTDLAGKAIEWAQSVDTSKSDYLYNLSILAKSEWVGIDKFGYLVSIIVAYNNACERETERAERRAKAADKGTKVYFGSPKVRSKGVKATCTGLNSFDGNYGVTTLVRFEARMGDAEYAPLVWFASGDKTEDFEVGNEYTFDATCKDHADHEKYGKQTRINRVTVKKGK